MGTLVTGDKVRILRTLARGTVAIKGAVLTADVCADGTVYLRDSAGDWYCLYGPDACVNRREGVSWERVQ